MKFAIFGTGGVGGYFGGRLANVGQDVTFIARGAHLAKITETGLRVDSIGGDFVVENAKATDSPQSVGEVDVIIVATKAWQLYESIELLKPLVGEQTLILPLLNGIEHIDLLLDSFGKHVLGGWCGISSFVAEPGRITHVAINTPHIAFGELNLEKSERVNKLFDIFSVLDGIDAEVADDIQLEMWGKFIFICATSGVGAVTRQPASIYRAIPESRTMLESAISEAAEVGRAKGVAIPNEIIENVMKRIDALPEGMVASMQKDIMEGKPSELDAQTGAVVRMGRAVDVATLTHEFIYASLLPMEMQARGK